MVIPERIDDGDVSCRSHMKENHKTIIVSLWISQENKLTEAKSWDWVYVLEE